MGYEKIDTLYNRNPNTFKVNQDEIRREEFKSIDSWLVTEKLDGSCTCILLQEGYVKYEGHKEKSIIQPNILKYLNSNLDPDTVASAFKAGTRVTLYGEAYGKGVQKVGELYRPDVSFRLFDVQIEGEWLPFYGELSITSIANKLGIKTVPVIKENCSLDQARAEVLGTSLVAQEEGLGCAREGIVAKTEPPVLDTEGNRVVWKLKYKDL